MQLERNIINFLIITMNIQLEISNIKSIITMN